MRAPASPPPIRRPARLAPILIAAVTATATGRAIGADPTPPGPVDFNRDVRPILSDRCYTCHGPDKNRRKADLRLDTRAGLLDARGDDPAIVRPGRADESALIERILAAGEERMPPESAGAPLSEAQVATLRRWVDQGAAWAGHWSLIAPGRPTAPASRNPIDGFVSTRLAAAGIAPSPEADRVALIRRLSFDLTGLPPSKAEADAFVADPTPDAYEKVVDRLIASPHYGERMAVAWLDLVRFADSIGYHSDNPMNVAPYRDYVIRSFNSGKPFDRFTVEQLAGDLLPDATVETRVASGYNRLLQTTEEGGAQPKEYVAKYAADRVRNASTVWLGATMGCAECHDHKYDPISQRDFYAFAAFFADIQESAVGRRELGMPVPDAAQSAEVARMDGAIAAARRDLDARTPERDAAQAAWESSIGRDVAWTTLEPEPIRITAGTTFRVEPTGILRATGKVESKTVLPVATHPGSDPVAAGPLTGVRVEALADPELPRGGPGSADNGNFVLTEVKLAVVDSPGAPPRPIPIARAVADHEQEGYPAAHAIDGRSNTGWAVLPMVGKDHSIAIEVKEPTPIPKSASLVVTLEFFSQFPQHSLGKFRVSATSSAHPAGSAISDDLRAALAAPAGARTEAQSSLLAAAFRADSPTFEAQRAAIADLQRARDRFVDALPKTLVSESGPPRVTRLLGRGNWQDEAGPVVEPAIPAALGSLGVADRRPTRLDLARWLVDPKNPLTARVFANRLWATFHGQGLSRVLDDLGSQGEWPTHPELLDFLATRFVDSGWDVKALVRLIVTSDAYRRSSTPRPDLVERDPTNRLLARQSAARLDAEFVRDNALAIAGLLSGHVGGESVKPYQPAGYWDTLNFPPRTYEADKGDPEYRRGLYVHRQRTFPHPSLVAFDAPSREECTAERSRSNIPQQALVLLNDPTYVEAARAFAARIVESGGSTPDRLAFAFGRAVDRAPTAQEARVLAGLLDEHLAEYRADPAAAREVVAVGQAPPPEGVDPAELAAWTSVARVLLNLHETITRP